MQHSVAPFRFRTAICQGFLIVVFMLLAGCSGPLVKSAITSNIVQEEAHNAFLLLNIIRAQERMPMHFTQVNTVRSAPGGIGIGQPTLGFELPFGRATTDAYKFSPSLAMASSVDTVSLVSRDFTRGITAPVNESLMVYFISQGWPQAMVFHVFIGSMEVIDRTGRVIYSIRNSPYADEFTLFKEVVRSLGACSTLLHEKSDYDFYTPVLSESDVKSWVKDVGALKNAGLIPVAVDAGGKALGAEAKKTGLIRYAATTKSSGLVFINPQSDIKNVNSVAVACNLVLPSESTNDKVKILMEAFRKQNAARLDNPESKEPEMHVRFVMRSTQSILYFLGELNRARKEGKENSHLTIRTRDNLEAPLFIAKCCEEIPNAAVSVSYQSKSYHLGPVRSEEYGVKSEDRSLQTLALVSLVYGLQNEGGEAPSIRNVRVIP